MEELLNKLIRKGWKPFGYNDFTKATVEENENVPGKKVIHLWTDLGIDTESLIRIICMKESGLWQFVYDNGYNQEKKEYREGYTKYNMKAEYWDTNDYEYYLIESALCDEEALEQFLLDNIKVDAKSN